MEGRWGKVGIEGVKGREGGLYQKTKTIKRQATAPTGRAVRETEGVSAPPGGHPAPPSAPPPIAPPLPFLARPLAAPPSHLSDRRPPATRDTYRFGHPCKTWLARTRYPPLPQDTTSTSTTTVAAESALATDGRGHLHRWRRGGHAGGRTDGASAPAPRPPRRSWARAPPVAANAPLAAARAAAAGSPQKTPPAPIATASIATADAAEDAVAAAAAAAAADAVVSVATAGVTPTTIANDARAARVVSTQRLRRAIGQGPTERDASRAGSFARNVPAPAMTSRSGRGRCRRRSGGGWVPG